MSKANALLEQLLGVKQFQDKPTNISGILQTKNYSDFIILSDCGNELHKFTGAKLANKCLPGDHVNWDGEKCQLELRDEHPPIVGTLELTNKSRYGLTSRGIPIYLFTPYNKCYPYFIVGCSEKDITKNKIGLIKFEDWASSSTFPRGILQQVLGTSGEYDAEKQALIWQASPWKYPKGDYTPKSKEKIYRQELVGFTFNIDPEGCRDVDDVLTFEKINDIDWRVTITISDVATYVDDGDVVDIYASLIGQTLYDNTGTVLRPMLPSDYSENTCSLIPGKESFGISLQFIWNGQEIKDKIWFESVLKTDKSYTYEEFQETDSPYKPILKDISGFLAGHEVNDSHKWIEYMMIFYNTEAGKILKENKTGILRRHSAPDIEKLEKYKACCSELEALAFSSAQYCLAEEDDTTHFGLETNNYAHASSPIRRYADLVNQRVLKIMIRKTREKYIVPQAMYDMNYKVKLNRNFGRDLIFLNAISCDQNTFNGIIIDKLAQNDGFTKVKIYIPTWKRLISTKYKSVSENVVLSRDEKREIDISDFRDVEIKCAFNLNQRNWKERVIFNIL
jgi:exoribonuclease R